MKISELLFPIKSNECGCDRAMHDPNIPRDDIISRIMQYSQDRLNFRIIIRKIYDEFGPDGVSFAREQLPYMMHEAIHTAPTKRQQFQELTELFKHKLAAAIAPTLLYHIIDDDGLNEEMEHMDPNDDVRPLIHKWLELNMPDMLEGITHGKEPEHVRQGYYSVLHGYDPGDYMAGHPQFNWRGGVL